MTSIYYIEGEHFHIPGISRSVRFTHIEAQKMALSLVNILRDDVSLPHETEPANWEQALNEARYARYAEIHGLDFEEVSGMNSDKIILDDDDDGYVIIQKMVVPDFPVDNIRCEVVPQSP